MLTTTMEIEKSLYDVLGLERRATISIAEVRASYRRLAIKFHPDRYPDRAEQFKTINRAYLVLSDPEKRKDYDRTLPELQKLGKKTLTIGDRIQAALQAGVRKSKPEKHSRPAPVTPVRARARRAVKASVAFRDFSPWAKRKIREEFGAGVGSSRWEPRFMAAQDFVDRWITPHGFVVHEDILSEIEKENTKNEGKGSDVPDTFFLEEGPPVRIWGKHRATLAAQKGLLRVTVYVRIS